MLGPCEEKSADPKRTGAVVEGDPREQVCLVLLPKHAFWLPEYIAELTGFPGTRHDDQVDSTTQALDYLRNNGDVFIWARLGAMDDPFGALARSLWPPIG
jgi:phage terminase large subunit-like protein